MNPIRRAYIMAHLILHGSIKRRQLAEAFGMSGRNATIDLTKFQELHGPLLRRKGRSHVYQLPEGYDTSVPMKCVEAPLRIIFEALIHDDEHTEYGT